MVVDTIVLVILLISACVAFWRGFIREFVTICGAAGGLFAAWMAGPHLQPFLRSLFDVSEGKIEGKLFGLLPYGFVADSLAYLIVFIAVFAILSFVSHILSEKARALGLGPVDRTLGVIFGLVRGLIIVGLLYLPVHLWGDKDMKKKWFSDSNTHVYVEATASWLANILPKETKDIQNPTETLTTRDVLEGIDVLKGDKNTGDTMPPAEDHLTAPQAGEKGYDIKVRQTLDTLIDEDPSDTPAETRNP